MLLKAASVPPVTAGAVTFAGFQLPDPIQILTSIWFAVLIAHKLWKWRIEAQQHKSGKVLKDDDDE